MARKALIIYHGNCDDGFGAAWVAYNALAEDITGFDEVKLHAGIYGQPIPAVDRETEVFVVDFSYQREYMQDLALQSKHVVVLDHHKTAKENLESLIGTIPSLEIHFDMSRSGAGMTWDYFHPNTPRPKLIEHIEDNDLWKFKIEYTKEFILALRSYDQLIDTWDAIYSMTEQMEGYQEFIIQGKTIQRYYNAKLQDVAKNASKVLIAGLSGEVQGLICNANVMFASDLGNLLAKQSGGIGVTWYENEKKEAVFSLRSIGDTIDVSAIAKCYGGGGHKNAAGFKLSPDRENTTFGNNEFGTTMIWHNNG